ncbi:MAG: CPBP family intramembrane glutamic endopeptidase [Proteiniphilum sp.]|jgi:membrane protease YdiL (CAAX protease family)|nr:CPBP family intramembrane metalloprotease [Proteiniphilum sp.]NCB26590.1 CPBP family intramembrane metalloprotease [Bacteroidia bacterium]MDD2937806.1 CPBP family intramembrane metalloprotease [Proteiniphilum sp.]MDD3779182.1 CPBP family intramembrane metalloprotease [Proteiniphilum sp.]MDD3956906.1 CPBP family intramembrane metalloprotease [Proteiniphilum sp.]
MMNVFIEHVIHLAIVLPVIFLTLTNRRLETLKILVVFSLYFLIHSMLLYLPIEFAQLSFIKGNWNWSGKIFAILGSILFLLLYRKFELKDYFLTFKQNDNFLKNGLFLILIIFVIKGLFNYFYLSPAAWNIETILFQSTMPGIDEEIAFRGIMLGLLTKILKPAKVSIFHPVIFVTALLFGMAHGLFLTDSYEISFNSSSFLITTVLGVAWAWITVKSGSILLALISHNLGNITSEIISISK